jgi:hypothetical protein
MKHTTQITAILGLIIAGISTASAELTPPTSLRCYYIAPSATPNSACAFDVVGPSGYHVTEVDMTVPIGSKSVQFEALTGTQPGIISTEVTDLVGGSQSTSFLPDNKEFMLYVGPVGGTATELSAIHCEIVPTAQVQTATSLPSWLQGKCTSKWLINK